ncbi:hypothetical protein [Nonomuraea sp. NEAU-A123]|uniref:hypothetical protein n=1 Tax=Nonomuraea sp. NEAU-A123 TaxID=2839649 RepID=UPI001BE4AEC8|nr:hypothetical protein [Nonomuraea sp. NEAU-A123]MBT2231308.1 hypothetical protein [Nonomuraea sp. NEAU-A123]
MSTLEDHLRQIMADETAKLRAAPDLVDRVLRSRRRKKRRVRFAALATSVAVAAAVVPAYLVLGPGSSIVQGPGLGPGEPVVTVETSQPDVPAIDDTPPARPKDLGDLGDGKAFGHVKVGYLPKGLRWHHWSVDFGDSYSTAWNYDGKASSFYCVQIYVYEGQAVQEVDDSEQTYRDKKKGKEVAVGDRTGYLIVQWVGEDGMKGTPTLFLNMGEGRRAEVMFSPVYAKKLGATKTNRELLKIAEGLTAD